MDVHFIPLEGSESDLASAALLSTVSDDSSEADAIFAKSIGLTRRLALPKGSRLVPPPAEDPRGLSGVDLVAQGRRIRKGPADSVETWLKEAGGTVHEGLEKILREIEERGHQAMVIADQESALGVIELS